MPPEPLTPRAIAFVDGQNLFHSARRAFGYSYPNYDVVSLAREACGSRRWRLVQVRFYTGVPEEADNAYWHRFWTAKAAAMGRQGVAVYMRRLKYRKRSITLADGARHSVRLGEEKGIDVRIAVDVIGLAYRRAYDVGIVFSQDQDLSELGPEIRAIAGLQRRWIKLACGFPVGPADARTRGIDRMDWIRIDRSTYDRCLDPGEYRPEQ